MGFSVAARGPVVSITYQGVELRAIDLSLAADPDDSYAEGVVRGVVQLLGDVQTDVIETLWTAWPTSDGRPEPAAAHAEVIGGDQVAWGYSYGSTPQIEFAPVPL